MKKYIIICFFFFFCFESVAQIKLPSIELMFKGGYSLYEGTQWDLWSNYNSITANIAANVNLNQYFAIGFFYNRSINGELELSYDWTNYYYSSTEHLIYGIRFRGSLNRLARFRPFIHFSYYKREMVAEVEELTIAHSINGIAPGLGLMIKINDRLYITIPEATVFISDEHPIFITNKSLDYSEVLQFFQLEAGISYYIHNKR